MYRRPFARQRGRGRNGNDAFITFLLMQLLHQAYQMEVKPPVTLALMAASLLMFFEGFLPPEARHLVPSVSSACLQPFKVLQRGEWGRLFWSSFLHGDQAHLYYNMSSLLWKGANLEHRMGSLRFAALVAELLLLCPLIACGLTFGLASQFTDYRPLYWSQCMIGFSGVLFALKVVLGHDSPGHSTVLGITLPTKYLCWAELVLASLISPQVSFLGHLAGIFAGLLHVRVLMPLAAGLMSGQQRRRAQHFSSSGRVGNAPRVPPAPTPPTPQPRLPAPAPQPAANQPAAAAAAAVPELSTEQLRQRRLQRFG